LMNPSLMALLIGSSAVAWFRASAQGLVLVALAA